MRTCRWIRLTLPTKKDWCTTNHRHWVQLATWRQVKLLARTIIFMERLGQARTQIMGRTAGWRGCLWEDSRRKAKKEIIIIIIRILRFWIISSRTVRVARRIKITTQEAVKVTVTNPNSVVDSLTIQTSQVILLQICKSGVPETKATNQVATITINNKCTWPWTSLLARPTTWTKQRWVVMPIIYLS